MDEGRFSTVLIELNFTLDTSGTYNKNTMSCQTQTAHFKGDIYNTTY